MALMVRVSLPQSETIWTAYETPGDLVRLWLGIGVCMLADLQEKERAKEWAVRARLVDPENVNLHYNLACAMVALGEIDMTLQTLADMSPKLSEGMMSWLETDNDFDPIREEPRFKSIIAQVNARLAKSS